MPLDGEAPRRLAAPWPCGISLCFLDNLEAFNSSHLCPSPDPENGLGIMAAP